MKYLSALTVLLLVVSVNTSAQPYYKDGVLKVCSDPYMLPLSNLEGEGYENKIAELLAEKMDLTLEYEFFPQRMGFVRNTLKREKSGGKYYCDLVITVPEQFELTATTDAYYTTTYSLAYLKGGKLDGLTDPDDMTAMVKDNNLDIIFGVTNRGPQQLWVFYNKLIGSMRTYQGMPSDIKKHPGQVLMEDLIAGEIDATIVWGPTAAYFAKENEDKAEVVLLPLKNLKENPEGRFEYSMAMGVRYGDKEWKEKVDQTIKDNIDEIHAILTDYGVPLVERSTPVPSDDDDD